MSNQSGNTQNNPVDLVNQFLRSSSDKDTLRLGQDLRKTLSNLSDEERKEITAKIAESGDFSGFQGELDHLDDLEAKSKILSETIFDLEKKRDGFILDRESGIELSKKNSKLDREVIKNHLANSREIESVDTELEGCKQQITDLIEEQNLLRDKIRLEYQEVIIPLVKNSEQHQKLLGILRGVSDIEIKEVLLRDDLIARLKKKYVDGTIFSQNKNLQENPTTETQTLADEPPVEKASASEGARPQISDKTQAETLSTPPAGGGSNTKVETSDSDQSNDDPAELPGEVSFGNVSRLATDDTDRYSLFEKTLIERRNAIDDDLKKAA